MSGDETPVQKHRSGEQPATYGELMNEVRGLRRESKDQNVEIAHKIDGVRDELRSGALRFEQHHARLNASEKWQVDHEEEHRELLEQQREEKRQAQEEKRLTEARAQEEKRLADAKAEAAAQSGPHWAVQAAVTTIITMVTTGVVGAVFYLLALAPKVTP